MKKKALTVAIIVVCVAFVGLLVFILMNRSAGDSNKMFADMKKVTSIKMIYTKETNLDKKLAKMFYNLSKSDLEEYTPQSTNTETGRQDYVIKFYRHNKELYHMQYYPEKENELEILIIKNTQQQNESRKYYKLTNQEIINYLSNQEKEVAY